MLIKEIFAADVTRNIAPVVYFHEKDPQKLQAEVSEYIITGGYSETDPRHQRIKLGIHEQFCRLLNNLAAELRRPEGPDLPNCWISGFYGSGKSSFAKLLGLALDGVILPEGRPLAEALLARDDSPNAHELVDAWKALRHQVDPIAVVFDVGAVARDDEHVHAAIRREVQNRLGYCAVSHYVAEHELKLELDGKWPDFLTSAETTLGMPWDEARRHQLAEEDFSHVMHVMQPDRYLDPMSWFDSRAGAQTGIGSSTAETTQAIADMLSIRAPGKTLFLVVDEVSQYIHQNDTRMLKLQSFASDIGQKLKGKVWLLATGQQKLEDSSSDNTVFKLKDRFPERLRVHLAATNIRDVVHKRLLKKAPNREPELRALFEQYRSELKLNGYACDGITEEDFVEVYPMLPGHVDLLMQITSNLRTRSTRIKGDDHAIRGLLQLLGELFREQKLGEMPLGALVTLDAIYEVQQSALDVDVQNTLIRIFKQNEVSNDPMAVRVAKAVALLQLIQEQEPTTSLLVSQCLYAQLGQGNQEPAVRQALEKLKELNLLSYSEKLGYKLQSSAGQDWQREREERAVTGDEISRIVAEKLKALVGTLDKPKLKGRAFPWAGLYTDGHQLFDERLHTHSDAAVVTVDFRYLSNDEDRQAAKWVPASDSDPLRDRILWVAGSTGSLPNTVRELARSRHIVGRYEGRIQSMPPERQILVREEQNRQEELEKKVRDAVANAFMEGELYFRGRSIDKSRQHGTTFATVLPRLAEELLPTLYCHYVETAVTDGELRQLLEPSLAGASHKFMKGELGILDLDAGKYVPTCSGDVPRRVLKYIQDQGGAVGSTILTYFGGPPCGHAPDVIRACLIGLLRASKIRIRPESGPELTSVRDPGAQDIFLKDRDLKRAEIFPNHEDDGVSPRDRNAICAFFEKYLHVPLDRENDAIADAVFQQFPAQGKRLHAFEGRLNVLTHRPSPPQKLVKLRQAIDESMRSRQVEDTVKAVKKNLDLLREGIEELGIYDSELSDASIAAVNEAQGVMQKDLAQLLDLGEAAGVQSASDAITEHLQLERPWRDVVSLAPHVEAIRQCYREQRQELIEKQERIALDLAESVKRRDGFAQLTVEQTHQVLRPIHDATYRTAVTDRTPTLLQLRDVEARLRKAKDDCDRRLDELIADVDKVQVIPMKLGLAGKEVSTEAEIDALLDQLRERLVAQLKPKTRIRLM